MDPHATGKHDNSLSELGDPHDLWTDVHSDAKSYNRIAKLIRVVDGDTIALRIDLGWMTTIVENVRLTGVNTPEMRGTERPAGYFVKEKVQKWFLSRAGAEISIRSDKYKTDGFGRTLATIWCSGECLNRWLLVSRYAWPTNRYGVIDGDRDIARLDLPGDILAQVRRRESEAI